MWHHHKSVHSTFASSDSKNVWAQVDSLGWRRVAPTSATGTANVWAILSTAHAHGRAVSVELDTQDLITTAYLK